MPGLTASEITASLDLITSKCQSAQGPANQITVITIALAVGGQGPVPVSLPATAIALTSTVTALAGTQPFKDKSDEDSIVKSMTTSVQLQQQLLNILIGKAGIVPDLLPFVGPPLVAVLRQYETAMDTLFFELINLDPDIAKDATNQKNTLDATMGQAITAWSAEIPMNG